MSQLGGNQAEGILSASELGRLLPIRAGSAFLFCAAFQQIGGGPPTLGRAICITQSTIEMLILSQHINT